MKTLRVELTSGGYDEVKAHSFAWAPRGYNTDTIALTVQFLGKPKNKGCQHEPAAPAKVLAEYAAAHVVGVKALA